MSFGEVKARLVILSVALWSAGNISYCAAADEVFCIGIHINSESQQLPDPRWLNGFANCTIILGSIALSNLDLTTEQLRSIEYPLFPNVVEISGFLSITNVLFPTRHDTIGNDLLPKLQAVHAFGLAFVDHVDQHAAIVIIDTNLHVHSPNFNVCVSCNVVPGAHGLYMRHNAFMCDITAQGCKTNFLVQGGAVVREQEECFSRLSCSGENKTVCRTFLGQYEHQLSMAECPVVYHIQKNGTLRGYERFDLARDDIHCWYNCSEFGLKWEEHLPIPCVKACSGPPITEEAPEAICRFYSCSVITGPLIIVGAQDHKSNVLKKLPCNHAKRTSIKDLLTDTFLHLQQINHYLVVAQTETLTDIAFLGNLTVVRGDVLFNGTVVVYITGNRQLKSISALQNVTLAPGLLIRIDHNQKLCPKEIQALADTHENNTICAGVDNGLNYGCTRCVSINISEYTPRIQFEWDIDMPWKNACANSLSTMGLPNYTGVFNDYNSVCAGSSCSFIDRESLQVSSQFYWEIFFVEIDSENNTVGRPSGIVVHNPNDSVLTLQQQQLKPCSRYMAYASTHTVSEECGLITPFSSQGVFFEAPPSESVPAPINTTVQVSASSVTMLWHQECVLCSNRSACNDTWEVEVVELPEAYLQLQHGKYGCETFKNACSSSTGWFCAWWSNYIKMCGTLNESPVLFDVSPEELAAVVTHIDTVNSTYFSLSNLFSTPTLLNMKMRTVREFHSGNRGKSKWTFVPLVETWLPSLESDIVDIRGNVDVEDSVVSWENLQQHSVIFYKFSLTVRINSTCLRDVEGWTLRLYESCMHANSSSRIGNLTCSGVSCKLSLSHRAKSLVKFQLLHCYLRSGSMCGNWTIDEFPTSKDDELCRELDSPSNRVKNSTLAGILVTVFFVIALTFFILYVWQQRKRKLLTRMLSAARKSTSACVSEITYTPDDWEVFEEKITLEDELGEGQFGMVYKGTYEITPEKVVIVAVKTLRNDNASPMDFNIFLEEASVMKRIGQVGEDRDVRSARRSVAAGSSPLCTQAGERKFSSPYIIQLLGIVSQGSRPLVIMEFMANGDLKTYLRSARTEFPNAVSPRRFSEVTVSTNINPAPTKDNYLQWATSLALAMQHIAELKFVHRDLSARNCMLTGDLQLKVGDFGLTRDVYESDYYRRRGRGALPIRWLAPESLHDGVYSSASDVWGYGVVLWEMATMATIPFSGMSNEEVMTFVEAGGHLKVPELNADAEFPAVLVQIMPKCWKMVPDGRPTFLELVEELRSYSRGKDSSDAFIVDG